MRDDIITGTAQHHAVPPVVAGGSTLPPTVPSPSCTLARMSQSWPPTTAARQALQALPALLAVQALLAVPALPALQALQALQKAGTDAVLMHS
jgi:hypothetical protein